MQGSKILIVEDEQIVALDLKDRIHAMGYRVVALAGSASEAISRALELRPDLVLMDVKLQEEMDGVEASRYIQQAIDVPVIFLTAYSDELTLKRAEVVFPHGYVIKPFDDRELQVNIVVALHRHQMERRLRESEAYLHAVFHSVDDAVLATTGDGTIKYMNPLAEYLTGWKYEEAKGLECSRVFKTTGPHDVESLSGPPPEHEILVSKDGTERAIESRGTSIRDERTERALGVVWTFRDVTERKRVQDAQRLLAKTSAVLASSLDAPATIAKSTIPVVPALADWCIVDLLDDDVLRPIAAAHANPQLAETLRTLERPSPGDDADHGIGRVIHRAQPELHADAGGAEWLASALGVQNAATLAGLTARSLVCAPLLVRGEARVLGTLTLASDRPGRRYGLLELLLAEDLARRIAMAIDNGHLYQDAQRAVRLREDVLAIVSHDLKNFLSLILTSAQMVAKTARAGDESTKRRALGMVRSAERMSRLITDLLTVGKIEGGSLAITPGVWPAATLLEEAVEPFELPAADRSIQLRVQVSPGELEGTFLNCDRERALQIFSNLVGNALKFTPDGGVISISATRTGSMMQFAVQDNGPGIPVEHQVHLFERYWQAPHARRKGAGLGLYIAKGIVEAHGGRIWVASAPGGGTTFYFTIPLAQGAEAHAPAP